MFTALVVACAYFIEPEIKQCLAVRIVNTYATKQACRVPIESYGDGMANQLMLFSLSGVVASDWSISAWCDVSSNLPTEADYVRPGYRVKHTTQTLQEPGDTRL